MPAFNRVLLLGNLTRDPELRNTAGGTPVAEFGMAVNDRRKNAQGEWVEDVLFVDLTAWGRTAEVAQEYLKKGAPCFIEGKLKLDQWETDGQKRSKLKVVVEKLQLLGGKETTVPSAATPQYKPPPYKSVSTPGQAFNDDDIPF
jgi:single-strand DNA-binding protein